MISNYKLNRALTTKAIEIVNQLNDDGVEIAKAMQITSVELDAKTTYLLEKEVPTNTVGRVDGSVETQRGFYQLTIATPFALGPSKNREITDLVRAFFPVGMRAGIEYENQQVSISTVSPSGMYAAGKHLKTALTINYTVSA